MEGYPLELRQSTKKLLQDGRWKTTPFYAGFDSPSIVVPDKFFRWQGNELFESNPSLFADLHMVSGMSIFDWAFKPYIIYTPKGGFKTSRIVKQLLDADGMNRHLCALPIGTVPIESSPHGLGIRTPYDFLTHDFSHAGTCFNALMLASISHLITCMNPITDQVTSDPAISTFFMLFVHEGGYYSIHRSEDKNFDDNYDYLKKASLSETLSYLKTCKNDWNKKDTGLKMAFQHFGSLLRDGLYIETEHMLPFHEVAQNSYAGRIAVQGQMEEVVDSKTTHYYPHNFKHYKQLLSFFDVAFEVIPTADRFYDNFKIGSIKYITTDFNEHTSPLNESDIEKITNLSDTEHLKQSELGLYSDQQAIEKEICKALGVDVDLYAMEEMERYTLIERLKEELLEAFKAKVASFYY